MFNFLIVRPWVSGAPVALDLVLGLILLPSPKVLMWQIAGDRNLIWVQSPGPGFGF